LPYLKKIEIKGFKTFNLKTTITLPKGLTVITGPNGSGKSNIIDAILFCLGDLSAKRLRAESLPSLIGPHSRSAKVLIQFDNSDQRIPVETTTVTISREINRKGQSVFRLNGRRISRGNLMEILSMAGIGHHGHNIVLQGTITRLAEITSNERRRMIEDMIGIAQYDSEKAEAEGKLKAAEIAIRTAMGRIGEVQKRVEDLERERNDLLRHRFIQSQIKRLEAIKVSQNILETEEKLKGLRLRVKELEERVEHLRKSREELRAKRREIEAEWRRLRSGEGQTRLLKVQVQIGELKSRLTELTTKINSCKSSLEELKRVRQSSLQQVEAIKREIEEVNLKIREASSRREKIAGEMEAKQREYERLSGELAEIKKNLDKNRERVRRLEKQLSELDEELVLVRSNHAKSSSTASFYTQRIREIESRRREFSSSLKRLRKSLKELMEVHEEQKKRLRSLQETIERRSRQKDAAEKEIREAGRIAEAAKDAVIEFSAQREVVEKIRAEEEALRSLEEMGELGVIQGIYGRLRRLIKVEKRYEKAVEAAASGWLDSLVVQDFNVAFTCSETLRRLKLGRVKIIPLKGISPTQLEAPPDIKGLGGTVASIIKCPESIRPAVLFVFGDTFLAVDRKAALESSPKGFRVVTVDGELYEAGGGVESGYYRAPIDLSTIVPSEAAVKSLDEAVKALHKHLERRKSEIEEMEAEIPELREEAARLTEAMARIEGEIERVNRSIERTEESLKIADENMKRIRSLIEKEKARMEKYKARRAEILSKERSLRREIAELRRKTNLSEIRRLEAQRESLGYDLEDIRRRLSAVEVNLSTFRSKLERVLNPSLRNAEAHLSKVLQQIKSLEEEIESSLKERRLLEEKIRSLEEEKTELQRSLLSTREDAERFTSEIDRIDDELGLLDEEYEQASELLSNARLDLQTLQIRLEGYRRRLEELGYSEPVKVSKERLAEVDSLLRTMRLELDRIGAVNQLADVHYSEQVSRYKELSLRMNELERERMAIIKFIEEIERKKTEAFMKAFKEINERLERYFSRLTDGGRAVLRLENPENPFAGGVDMTVEFKGKPPILISGASSGERSVATVAFLLALQEFTPASFYIFDEIDAHLDPFYVEKLGDFLNDESSNSQFLVITLKPEMINKADKVYGVYMRNGTSHVISTRFKEAS